MKQAVKTATKPTQSGKTTAPTKQPPKKVVGTQANTRNARGSSGPVPGVGFGKQRVEANRKLLALARAKLAQRGRSGK